MIERFEQWRHGLGESLKGLFREESPGDLLGRGVLPPTTAKWKELTETHKLSNLLPYEYYDEVNGLFFNEDAYGFVLEVAPPTGLTEGTVRTISGMFAQGVPAETTVQTTLYASPDVLPLFKRWANNRVADPGTAEWERNENIYRQLARRRIDYLMDGNWKSLLSDQPLLVRDFRLVFSVLRPLPPNKEPSPLEVERLLRFRSAVTGGFKSAGIATWTLDDEGLLNLLDTILNPRHHRREPIRPQDDLLLREQAVSPETLMLVGRDGLHFEGPDLGLDVRCFTVREYPNVWAGWQMGDLIGSLMDNNRRISCPFLVTATMQFTDQLNAVSEAKMKAARATQMADSQIARFLPSWAEKRDEWNFVVGKMGEGHTTARMNSQIVLFAPHGEGDHAEHQIRSVYRSLGWGLVREKFTTLHTFLSALPFTAGPRMMKEAGALYRLRTFLTWTYANIAPFVAEWKGTGTPLLQLVGRRGQLMYVDQWDNRQGNYNVAVAAASGAGKSFFTAEVVLSVLGAGGIVWAFDRGRSYQNLCEILGGTFLEFSGKKKISLNPFTHIRSWEGDEETGSERVMIKSLLIQMVDPQGTGLDQTRRGWIEQALNTVWQAKGREACITDIYDHLKAEEDERKRDLGDALFPYTRDGFYGTWFDGPSNVDLAHDFVVLELQELDGMPELQAVIVLLLIQLITQTMYLGDKSRRKLCLIDEAWKLMGPKAGNAGDFIEEGYRTARKFNGSMMTITQGINDYYKSGTAEAALQNSDWTILLRQKDDSIAALAESKRLPSGEEGARLLKSLRTIHGSYSEMAVISPDGMSVGRLVVDPFSEKLYSTKGEESQAIRNMVDQGRSITEAIEHLAKGSRR